MCNTWAHGTAPMHKRIFGGNQNMKRNLFKRAVCLVLTVALLLGTFSLPAFAAETETKKPNGTAATLEEMQALVGTSPYVDYIKIYKDFENPDTLTDILVYDAVSGFGAVANESDFIGDIEYVSTSDTCLEAEQTNPDNWLELGDKTNLIYLPTVDIDGKAASASWNFEVPNGFAGLYNLYIEYYNCKTSESSVSSIQKSLKIDGKVPFDEVSSISFDKHWAYNNAVLGEPTVAPAGSKVGTYYDYATKDDGYYKYVTTVYLEGDTLMQTVDSYKILQDINGNSMSPEVIELSEWSTYICNDTSGYTSGYFQFYLSVGQHIFTLDSEREPMIIKSIKFVPVDTENTATDGTAIDYETYLSQHDTSKKATGGIINIQAEFPDLVSDSSVVPSNSNDSAVNYPITAASQLFNVIGETGYSAVGQWAAYNFTVNEDGFYKFAMRYKQDALQGMFICRTLKLSGGEYGLIDGSPTVPFEEAQNIRFDYSDDWQSNYLGDADTEFEFYFEKGVKYTLYVECSLGDLKDYIQSVEQSLSNINECYLKIIQRTGSSPDANQTYDFQKIMPEVLVTLLKEAVNITRVADELEELCGTNGSHLATLDSIARILNIMGSNNGEDIAANLATLKSYLGTLATWINDSKTGAMMIDGIYIVPVNTNESIPKAKAGFFESIWFEISSFIYSFFTNYDQMGLTKIPDANTQTIDVWLASGRDQSQIWRTLIDSDGGYTEKTGNAVALKLVTAGTLLPSILSGKGPDVYMGLSAADVINYAIRDAVLPVSGNSNALTSEENATFNRYVYEDANGKREAFTAEQLANKDMSGYTLISEPFSVVKDEFAPAAVNALTLLDVTYGTPMTMGFAMMFYRMDVLAELGQEVPESWDELIAMLPALQSNNMTVGVNYVSALDFMMYQKGGNMWKYTNRLTGDAEYDPLYAGSKIDLDSNIALESFEFVCRFYTEHSLPVSYDAANRFRTGEMPIVIGDYTTIYNTLAVYATEISGLWEFCSLPGSENPYEEDGFNYDSLASTTATVILYGCDDIQSSWEFVQWQTSAKTQAEYGNRIVALIGPAAKYETANLAAIEDLSWTASEKAALRDQMNNLNAVVNYPGSYIIARYMNFAFFDAYNNGANPYEALMSYVPAINDEIARKRKEFDLPIAESEEEALLKPNAENNQ